MDNNIWEELYKENKAKWDAGEITTPIKEYIDQLKKKNIKILTPGSGNSYEAEYLFNKGFKNVYVIDLAQTALSNFKKRVPQFPSSQIINDNFFSHAGKYDLIIEQTFFCAIDPGIRHAYAEKVHDLLHKEGKLVGLLFDDPLNSDEPPYGGNKEEYVKYFKDLFIFNVFEPAYNSIKPRAGRELFINFSPK